MAILPVTKFAQLPHNPGRAYPALSRFAIVNIDDIRWFPSSQAAVDAARKIPGKNLVIKAYTIVHGNKIRAVKKADFQ